MVRVITLVLVLRHSNENRSNKILSVISYPFASIKVASEIRISRMMFCSSSGISAFSGSLVVVSNDKNACHSSIKRQ